jgi:DNA-directed RNA polymerase specialized sigma24 family protein
MSEPDFWDDLHDRLMVLLHENADGADEVAAAQVARNATDVIEELMVMQRRISVARVEAVRMMNRSGMTYGEIAAAVGLTRQRIFQLVDR